MATQARPGLTTEEKFDLLAELYLTLWKQLDFYAGAKWLQVRAVDPAELKAKAESASHRVAQSQSDVELISVVKRDFDRTQEFVSTIGPGTSGQLDALKDYLRDQGLRYAQAAAESRAGTVAKPQA